MTTTTYRDLLHAAVSLLRDIIRSMALSTDGATGYWGDAPQGGVYSWQCGNSHSDGIECAHHMPDARRVRVQHEMWVMPTNETAALADALAGLMAEEEGIYEALYYGASEQESITSSYEILHGLPLALRNLLNHVDEWGSPETDDAGRRVCVRHYGPACRGMVVGVYSPEGELDYLDTPVPWPAWNR